MNVGPAEILVVLLLALLVFGPKRLPEVSRQVGEAMRELRRMQHTVRSEIDKAIREPTPTLPPKEPSDAGRHLRAIEPDDHEGDSWPAPDAETPPEPGDSFQ